MILRLAIFLLGYAALLLVPVGAAAYIGRRRLAEWWQERQLRLQGKHNARLLMDAEHRRCKFCLEICEPEVDCCDESGWYHRECLKTLLGEIDD